MTTLFVLLFAAALVAFVLTKKSQAPIKLVGNVKKVEAAVAKTFDVNKLIPKMTAQDKAMLKILQQKYGKNVYKG